MERMRFAAPVVCGVSLLCICVLVLGMFPARPAEATSRPIVINDLLDDFAEGTFLQTALLKDDNQDLRQDDLDGSIGLALTGKMGELVGARFDLPTRLTQMGVAGLESRLYVFGGREAVGDDTLEPTGDVWSGEVSLEPRSASELPLGDSLVPCADGEDCPGRDPWRRELALPAVVGSGVGINLDDPVSRTHSIAVTAVDNPTGDDYIYVLGGAGGGFREKSQFSVRIAVVDNSVEIDSETGEEENVGRGAITEWITSDDIVVENGGIETYPLRIPGSNPDISPGFEQYGVQLASATTVRVNGTTYLYLVGGQTRRLNPSSGEVLYGGSSFVYYARVGDDGLLYRPDTTSDTEGNIGWAQQSLPESVWKNAFGVGVGIWNSAVVAGNYGDFGTALYIIGGQIQDDRTSSESRDTYTSSVVRLLINEADGSLIMDPDTGAPDDWVGEIGNELFAHGAVEFRSNLYVTGGQQGKDAAEPTDDGLTSYVEFVEAAEEAVMLHDFDADPDRGIHFAAPGENDDPPLIEEVRFHGMTLISDGFDSAFLYVMGGSLNSESGHSDDVSYLRISRDNFQDPIRSSLGWYYSPRQSLDIDEDGDSDSVILENIEWHTDLSMRVGDSAAVDIEIAYRTSPDTCDRTTWTSDDWEVIDGAPDQDYYSAHTVNTDPNKHVVHDLTGLSDEEINALPQIQCFQYRARLTTNETDVEAQESPALLSLQIRAYTKDSPDMHATIEPVWVNGEEGKLADLAISIENLYAEEPEKTLRADVEYVKGGLNPRFFIDLFVFEPGENVDLPGDLPDLPMDSDLYDVYSDTIKLTVGNPYLPEAQVGALKELWPPRAVREIYPRSSLCSDRRANDCLLWIRENEDGDGIEEFDPKFLFTETGTYNVCVAVDSYISFEDPDTEKDYALGQISETLDGAEDNNYACTEVLITDVPEEPLRLYLPLVAK